MEDNNLEQAWEALHDKSCHTLLTGDAGTGKSTLIREFIAANEGKVVMLAPTGIAAVNIGGMTIHRFFCFPARPIGYNQIKWLNNNNDADFLHRKTIEAAEFFIIDEVFMVRADIMDQIAWFFHKNFGEVPFAGKKIIMVGDGGQLPPVIATEEEKAMLAQRYKTEFFFSANCWNPEKHTSFKTFNLTKVWRQSDPTFISMLNGIKNNNISPFAIDHLNNSCYKEGILKPEDGIMLCTTNAIAAEVNGEMISRLPGEIVNLAGQITGNFDPKNCRVDAIIDLKSGCRVMIMVNDKDGKYSNGSIGTFKGKEASGFLHIVFDNGAECYLGQYVFESVEFAYDKINDRINTKPTGKFIQYPIKVAYAITIHKSQGQTFEKVIIDLGDRGAFAHGQVYVALSRCTTMQGIILRRKITSRDLIYNKSILEFNKLTA